MRFPYRRLITRTPVISLGGIQFRFKPIIRVRLTFAGTDHYEHGLLDSGSDDTVFPRSAAEQLGIDISGLPLATATGAGSTPVPYAVAPVQLSINEFSHGCTWTALVGFRLDRAKALPLLGQAGCLQFFTAEFRGDTHEVVLTPNASFSGQVT